MSPIDDFTFPQAARALYMRAGCKDVTVEDRNGMVRLTYRNPDDDKFRVWEWRRPSWGWRSLSEPIAADHPGALEDRAEDLEDLRAMQDEIPPPHLNPQRPTAIEQIQQLVKALEQQAYDPPKPHEVLLAVARGYATRSSATTSAAVVEAPAIAMATSSSPAQIVKDRLTPMPPSSKECYHCFIKGDKVRLYRDKIMGTPICGACAKTHLDMDVALLF